MRGVLLVLLTSGLSVQNCNITWPPGGRACTTEFRYGLTVEVTSAATGAPITNATLTLTEGSYVEAMERFPTGDYVGAGERAGTYTLTAEASGFQTKTVSNIVVTADECHVKGVRLEVELEPSAN